MPHYFHVVKTTFPSMLLGHLGGFPLRDPRAVHEPDRSHLFMQCTDVTRTCMGFYVNGSLSLVMRYVSLHENPSILHLHDLKARI